MTSQQNSFANVATIGIDIGKTTFHLIGQDRRGAIIMRAKLSRTQLMRRLVNVPQCVIGMEPCAGAHHIARRTRGRTIHSLQSRLSRPPAMTRSPGPVPLNEVAPP